MRTKVCGRCGVEKAETEYTCTDIKPNGTRVLRSWCKVCNNEKRRAVAASAPRPESVRQPRSIWYPDPDATPPVVEFKPQPPPRPTLPPLENAFAERIKEREKRDLRSEHRALLDEVERLRKEVDVFTRASRAPEVLVYRQPAWERSDAVVCAALSDWHAEEPVISADVMGLNEYNLDVAKSRSRACFVNLLRLAQILARDSVIRTIHLSILGDLFSGWIHEELLATTLLAPADAAIFVNGLLCSGIDYLLREGEFNVEVDALPGNHGRMTDKMHFGDPTGTSLESVLYAMVAARYETEPRVTFRVAQSAEVHVRFFEKFRMRLVHGYEIKYQGGVGGITIPINKRLAQWNQTIPCDLTVMGHYHQFFDGGRFLVNGSLIGYNNFARAHGFAFEEPTQALWLVHARKGGQKALVAPIWLDEKHETRDEPGKEDPWIGTSTEPNNS